MEINRVGLMGWKGVGGEVGKGGREKEGVGK